jgi:RNase H-like domain found in reverse transcriptase
MPDFTKPFTIKTYVCGTGVGEMLIQQKKHIAYFSKALIIKSQFLSTYENKLLALIMVVQKWRHCLQEEYLCYQNRSPQSQVYA